MSNTPSHDDNKSEKSAQDVSPPEQTEESPPEYPSNQKRIVIMIALYLAIFLVTLDQNIISTAIPRITDEFHSLEDIGWYGSAYLLTMCAFQLVMGKVLKYYPTKPIFLACISLFEIGSAVCGSAPTSKAFIVGRAIAGLGASGLFSGVMVIMFHTIPLQQRPIYQGLFGAVFAVGSVVGPLIGGTFTDKVTWRWCFYINLPVGAVTIVVISFILQLSGQKLDKPAAGFFGKLKQLDPIGNLVFFPGIVCLILALQWGGTRYNWDNVRIIVLLILCAVLCLIFVGIQIWKKESATVPPRLVVQRSMAGAIGFGFLTSSAMMTLMYYLPIWFQAIKGVSAVKSGIMLLPLVLSTVLVALLSGVVISKVGYYAPFFIICPIVMAVGCGLLTTLTPTSNHPKWIGYQILVGVGLGFGMQQPMTVAQTVLNRSDIATGTAVVTFTRFLGSAIFLPVAQNVFLSRLIAKLTNLPGIDPSAVTAGGATELRTLATGNDLNTLLSDYNGAIVDVFYITVAMSALAIIPALFVEWRSVKDPGQNAAVKTSNPKEDTDPKESV